MKKLVIAATVLLMAGFQLNAQDNETAVAKAGPDKKEAKAEKKEAKKELRKLKEGEVSVLAQNHFYRDFDKKEATWKRTAYFDEADFIQDGKPMTAYYDDEAELVGTTSPADFSDLSMNAQNSIRKQYKDYKVKSVLLFDDNEINPLDMVIYGSVFSDEDNYFVELSKGTRTVVLKVNMEGAVSFFTERK